MKEDRHVAALEHQHQALKDCIHSLSLHPSASEAEIKALKIQKLKVKDKIESLKASNGAKH